MKGRYQRYLDNGMLSDDELNLAQMYEERGVNENHQLYFEGKVLSNEHFRLAFEYRQERKKRLAEINENYQQADSELIKRSAMTVRHWTLMMCQGQRN